MSSSNRSSPEYAYSPVRRVLIANKFQLEAHHHPTPLSPAPYRVTTPPLDESSLDLPPWLRQNPPDVANIHGSTELKNNEEVRSDSESGPPVYLVGPKGKGSDDDGTTSRAEDIQVPLRSVHLLQALNEDLSIHSENEGKKGGRQEGNFVVEDLEDDIVVR